MNYYLIGIKGSGMSALACMLSDLGHSVVGSDVSSDFGFEEGLKKRNIEILDFNQDNISKYQDSYIYIIGNSQKQNEETISVINKQYCYYYYHDFIGQMRGIKIAVSGTHGKTTTTKLLAHLLKDEKIACLIGDGTGFGVVDYRYFIFEACEYQNHFLSYFPDYLVITNIEYDHPDFFKSYEDVVNSFEILKKQSQTVIETSHIDYQIIDSKQDGFTIKINESIFELPFCGLFMVENFVVAYQLMKELGFDDRYIKQRINDFQMPKRRSEIHEWHKAIIVFDYGHHPSEIRALYQSLTQKYPKIKKTVFFQPHTYSRTIVFKEAFISSLGLFDEVYIDDVFTSSREVRSEENEKAVAFLKKQFHEYHDGLLKMIDPNVQSVWIFLGAGVIHQKIMPFLNKE